MEEMQFARSMQNKEYLLRAQSAQKMKLKEKFVEIYDQFLRGQDPSQGQAPDVFWDGLFLIKVNKEYLSKSLREMSEDQLLAIKDGINSIFLHAVQAMRDPLAMRRLHAMETLRIVLGEIFKKKFHNWSFDVIHLLTGLSHADLVFRTLVQCLSSILMIEESLELRVAALRLAIALACGNDNVNKNSLNEYFMQKDIFPALVKFIVEVESFELAFEAMTLLSLLANYNKYEIQNPYLANLTTLNDVAVLDKMITVTVFVCDNMRESYIDILDDDEMSTIYKVTSALSYVTGMLWDPKSQDSTVSDAKFALLPDSRITVLLLLYDMININKLFLERFLKYPTSSTTPPNPDFMPTASNEPGLGTFLSFCSYLFQHNRTNRSAPFTNLCLLIILLIVQDPKSYPYLCSIPQSEDTPGHGVSETAVIRLCRQRQPLLPKVKSSRPLAAVLLDVVLIYMKHNLRKKLPTEGFRVAVGIIHAMATRFKSQRVRLPYHWAQVWDVLIGLVKFLQTNAQVMSAAATSSTRPELRELAAETMDLVTYFVTFGDMLMPEPTYLYALFYEIVRTGVEVFSNLANSMEIEVNPPLPAQAPHQDLADRNRLNMLSPQSAAASAPGTPSGLSNTQHASPQNASPFLPSSPTMSLPSSPPSPYGRAMSPPAGARRQNDYNNGQSHGSSPNHHNTQQQNSSVRLIIDLSNINDIYLVFFQHLLTWRDANPTRSLGPGLVSNIIKEHYPDLVLGAMQQMEDESGSGNSHSGRGSVAGKSGGSSSGGSATGISHTGWQPYAEVPKNVHFFRQLTRWVVADFRAMSR